MKFRMIVASVIATLALASGAAAQDRRDQRLADEISASVRRYPQFTIFDDVSGHVEDGVVVLTGKVTMPYKKAGDRARSRPHRRRPRGAERHHQVLPVSNFDDDLRQRVARAIYGSPSFWTYAAMANPPIHIIVENGRVTLTGVVNSSIERAMARSLATGLGELSVVNELRTDR